MSNIDQVIDDMKYYFNAIRDTAKAQGISGYMFIGMVMEPTGNAGMHMAYPSHWSAENRMSVLKQMTNRIEEEMKKEQESSANEPRK